MKNILSISRRFSIWMVLLAFLGCSDDDLEGLPQVVSSFTYTVNEDTGTVTFVNVSEGARTYVWDFGDGTTSKEIDPIKTYSDSGTFTVSLVASNQAGASSTFEDELTLNIKKGITLPITFDDANVIYKASTFEGAAFEIVANPDLSGSNDKETNVGQITNSGTAFEGLFFDLETAIDLTTEKTITMNFWSEVPVDVLMKLEEGTGAASETTASHGGTGWEEIAFDFTSSEAYTRLTLFVDGPGTTAGTFYIDDIAQSGGAPPPGGGDCTEETSQSLDASDFNLTFQTDPGSAIIGDGAAYSYIDNPDTDNDVNPSCKVGQIDRDPGLPFANNQIVFDSKFDFTANTGFKLKVWAPVAGTNVLLKLEDKSNSAVNTEVAAVTATGNAWEELTFDFSSVPSDTYDKIVLFFDINTDSGATYYIDDFALYSDDGGGDNPLEDCGGDLVNDFESADDSIFSNFGGGVGTVIDNPDTSVNPSAKVGQYVKNAGEVFAGITIEVDPDIDFNAGVFSIDVNSQAVRQLLFKLEGLGIEQVIATSGTGWETITYDFSSVAGNVGDVTAITLIMDNGTAGDGSADWTIQLDNIRLCSNESSGGDNPLEDCGGDLVNDFESADDSIFSNFGGGVGTVIDNPDTSVNPSAKLGQYVKGAGEVFAGITIEVDPDIDFNAGVFSIDVNSQAVRQLLFKLEGLGIEQVIATSGTGWETITYDFSSVAGNVGDVTAITLIMDNGTAGDGSADWTIQLDNIRLCSNESSGGDNPLEDCGGDLVNDFESADDSIFSNFGGGVGTVIDNPDTSVNPSAKLGQYVKGAGEVFAGITIEVDPDIDFNAGVFSIDVNSQAVRQLLFKLEGLGIEQVIATSGTGWETITYDFSSVAGNVGDVTAITLIMDNGTAGDGSADWTIQFDNIRLCSNENSGGGPPGSNLAVNGDFETGDDTGWFIFQNGGSASLDNTTSNGGTWSGSLNVSDSGGNPAFKQERIGAGTVAAGDVVQVQFDHIGSVVQPGAAVNVLLFGESPAGASFTQVLTPGPVLENTWTTYTGTFTIPAGTDVSEGISFLIETVCGAVAGCNVTMNIDNVSVTLNP